jgi:type III pantothenate kinase
MLFAVDIGNSTIVLAINDGNKWKEIWKIHTDTKKTSDEYYLDLKEMSSSLGIGSLDIDKAIISSVVPALTLVFGKVCFKLFGIKALIVDSKTVCGLDRSTIPEELGSDILCDLVAAHGLYPDCNATVLDFGTALTVSTVSPDGKVLGVAIAPGLITSVNALAGNTAQLPFIELKQPETVLGRNSIQSIRAGILFGFAGLVESLIKRTETEISAPVKVIATGGLCMTISPMISRLDHVDKNHTLNGLKIISDLN